MSDNDIIEEPRAQSTQNQSRGQGIFPSAIFGGAVACALGFFGGQLDWVEERLGLVTEPKALASDVAAQSDTIGAQLAEQAGVIDALKAQLAELAAKEPPKVDLTPINGVLDTQAATLKAQGSEISKLADRVLTVEKRPMTDNVSREAIAAYEKELAGLQETIRQEELRAAAAYKEQLAKLQGEVESQQAEVERILSAAKANEADAADKARRAQARAALAKVVTAVDDGTPFGAAVADLENSGAVQVPDVLKSVAVDGVVTLAALQSEYPAAARAALAKSRAVAEDANTVGGFLKRQLGARSVAPRDGDDPDAVLSRAEAAVRAGKLESALTEIAALPEEGKAAMAAWAELAEKRHAAQAAAAELTQSLNN